MGKEEKRQQFTEAEKENYLQSIEKYQEKRTIAEQTAEGKAIPEEEREHWKVGILDILTSSKLIEEPQIVSNDISFEKIGDKYYYNGYRVKQVSNFGDDKYLLEMDYRDELPDTKNLPILLYSVQSLVAHPELFIQSIKNICLPNKQKRTEVVTVEKNVVETVNHSNEKAVLQEQARKVFPSTLKKGYKYTEDGTIVGPKGGMYEKIGKTTNGSIVYKNSSSYYTFEKGAPKRISSLEIVERDLGKELYSGGRLGGLKTRAQNEEIADYLKSENWKIIGGGNKTKEEYMEALIEGDKKGANYIDVTATKIKNGKEIILRINTVDTYKTTGALTKREAIAEQLINIKLQTRYPEQPKLITIPKEQGLGNLEKVIEKILEESREE